MLLAGKNQQRRIWPKGHALSCVEYDSNHTKATCECGEPIIVVPSAPDWDMILDAYSDHVYRVGHPIEREYTGVNEYRVFPET